MSQQPLAPPDAQALQARHARDERLAHLFRMSRREGLIHPLQHLIERYRSEAEREQAAGKGAA